VAADALAVAGRPAGVASVRDVELADGVSGRLYVPAGAGSGLLVYFHGGGFVVGSVEVFDAAVRALAVASGVRVLSVDYRLAPEHPFPAAADDAWSAWCAAVARADEFGCARMAVGGDSAGGNLAAGVALRAAASGGPAPRLQLLIYPWLELAERSWSRREFAEGFYLTDEDLTWYASHYLGDLRRASDARASPLRAESVAGAAPAYIATAGFDTLRDEAEAYADRLRGAGVPVVLRRHAGLVHGYFNMAAVVSAARDALQHAAGAVALALAGDPR
jgi:acetyl esterase